jgi:D-alanine-D-alanine ligase
VLTKNSDLKAVIRRLGTPLFVKPASEGSSVGMSKVKRAAELEEAFALAVNYDPVVIAEKFIAGPELTVAILGDEVLPIIRIETPREFYDYEAKYLANDTRYLIPCGLSKVKEKQLQAMCLKAFRALGCRGWGRVDLMLDRQGRPYLLEINTSPGMTDHSLVPMAAKAVGISYEDLCVRILEMAHVG